MILVIFIIYVDAFFKSSIGLQLGLLIKGIENYRLNVSSHNFTSNQDGESISMNAYHGYNFIILFDGYK